VPGPAAGVRRLRLVPDAGDDDPYVDIHPDGSATLDVWLARGPRDVHFSFPLTPAHVAAAEASRLRAWAVSAVVYAELAVFAPDARPSSPPPECARAVDTLLLGSRAEVEAFLTEQDTARWRGQLAGGLVRMYAADARALEAGRWFAVEPSILSEREAEQRRRAAEEERRQQSAAVALGTAAYAGALGRREDDPVVQALLAGLGGDPVVAEHAVGAPARLDRHLAYPSGIAVVVRDGVVHSIVLHVQPTPAAPRGMTVTDLGAVLPGVRPDSSREEVRAVLGDPVRGGWSLRADTFAVGAAYARVTWSRAPGAGIERVTLRAEQVATTTDPAHTTCPDCSTLLVRSDDQATGGVDVDATVERILAGVADGRLDAAADRVRPADLRALRASGLVARAECHLTCRRCHRVACLTLHRDGAPTFAYLTDAEARRHPREPVPPVEQWADAARVAEARAAMRVVEEGPGAWFLLERDGELYLDARYSYSAVVDDSALVRLEPAEREAYAARGRAYLDELQEAIHHSAPYQSGSPYHARNLFRGADGKRLRDEVTSAVWAHRSERA